MDDSRFDTLTRALSSRRAALAGLLSGVAALLGVSGIEEASAHNPAPACRRIADPRRRRACLRRARAHKRKKHSCKPKPAATFCANRCGTTQNNCKQKVRCTCPAGKLCLANTDCLRTCAGVPFVPCPPGCTCGFPLAGNPAVFGCYATGINCGLSMTPCITSANCPRGFFCGVTGCPGFQNRCILGCPV